MPTGYQIKDQAAPHYLTFQIVYWVDLFSRKSYRDIVIDSLRHCSKEKGLEIFAYVIMTNHVHLIVRSSTGDLSGTIRDLKKYTSKKVEYIHNNPVRAAIVKNAEDYVYSSAGNYAGKETVLEIVPIMFKWKTV